MNVNVDINIKIDGSMDTNMKKWKIYGRGRDRWTFRRRRIYMPMSTHRTLIVWGGGGNLVCIYKSSVTCCLRTRRGEQALTANIMPSRTAGSDHGDSKTLPPRAMRIPHGSTSLFTTKRNLPTVRNSRRGFDASWTMHFLRGGVYFQKSFESNSTINTAVLLYCIVFYSTIMADKNR